MQKDWTDIWDERYSMSEYAYGESPNDYLKEQLSRLIPGRILFPAEGEGRNAVFAATQGWQASAYDISSEGRKKAMQLARKKEVTIDYRVGELNALDFEPEAFDAIALIYAHFPAALKSGTLTSLDQYLRPGGVVIFEAFSKNHLSYLQKNEKVGGPKDVNMLYSTEEIKACYPDYEVIELQETEIELREGLFHNGLGSVIRFVGRKPL
ncbi:MAG: class I SAM-dependent methyltransferase [Saprospiraceae bacterium]|nr:class I SAM-dependent methyltransferase [Saprospiraceae bacterium]